MFTESAAEREINAVDSEHEKNIPSDLWRLDQLDKHTADPSHPYHKFGTGNKKTLFDIPKAKGINARDELLKFHDTWYSANIMTFAVLGKGIINRLHCFYSNNAGFDWRCCGNNNKLLFMQLIAVVVETKAIF